MGAIPADVRPIVQDQIALLETGRMGLLGSWEGRPFSLEIEPDDNGPRSDDIPLSWRVKIQIDAPNLGKLELDVALAGTQASVAVRPDAKTTKGQALRDVQAALASTSGELQSSLDARGLQMTGLSVAPATRPTADRS
ncbi:flagellar hook-length control protein FliK [Pigmentiphaga litoralis]|uniref:flagellar hook-length control protein FliK n=1 Tax=Pigmentiphaga litoralis TaxID=516702 RepID=UPI003B43D40D